MLEKKKLLKYENSNNKKLNEIEIFDCFFREREQKKMKPIS